MIRRLVAFAVTAVAWALSACAVRTGALPVQRLADARGVQRAAAGYRIPVWYGQSHVTVAEPDWIYLETIFPVTRSVIDPDTGASLRFDYLRFGRDWRQFGLWGWTVPAHQWARAVGEMADPDERAAAFLRSWIDLTLRRGKAKLPDDLALFHTRHSGRQGDRVLAAPCHLRLDPHDRAVPVTQEVVGAHRFAVARAGTRCAEAGGPVRLDTTLYATRFRHFRRLDEWEVFVAALHVPEGTPGEAADRVRRALLGALASLVLEVAADDPPGPAR